MERSFAGRMQRTIEPLVGMIFFVPENNGPEGELATLGLEPWPTGYFASRGWALGRTSPAVIVSTFYNFSPVVATRGIPECWDKASPEEIGEARDRAATAALARLTAGAHLPDMKRVHELLQRAVDACRTEGRTLFSAIAHAPWPDDDPLLTVWHGANRLREYRGDGHVALLAAEGVSPVEALVLHAGIGEVPKNALLQTRAWTEDDWAAACSHLAERGLCRDGEVTDDGRRFREELEDDTNRLSMDPWRALGDDDAEELRVSLRAITQLVVDNGGVPGRIGRLSLERS